MIKQSTIDAVISAADIIDIIGRQVKLKKAGANYTGLCPFHNEKSPSFSVSPSKSIYKCFGCGKSGNAVSFYMESEKKSFPETIEALAEQYHIAIEYDQQQQVPEETKNKKSQMHALLKWATEKYEQALYTPAGAAALNYLYSRGYTDERIKEWNIGYAPADFKFLTTDIINKGLHGIATELKLVSTKEGTSYDFYYNRIIVPIYNENGFITGFAGRQVPGADAEADKKFPKWMNPPNSIMYNKSKTWYGLNTARKTLVKEKMLYLVEGYPDVHTMQDNGMENTVAPCGKEVADEQALFLKKYTDHVCFIPNIDANHSGQDAVLKHIDKFISLGFRVSVIELPKCNDADEYIREMQKENNTVQQA